MTKLKIEINVKNDVKLINLKNEIVQLMMLYNCEN